MKGLVFVELLKMAETAAGEDVVDEVLDGLDLASGGAYSAVGAYPCGELFAIVGALSERLAAPVDALQYQFGQWMFARFVEGYPEFFHDKTTAFDMLEAIENEVHVEVRKLYPDAELPSFDTVRKTPDVLLMMYRSERPLASFCHGLIAACVAHFGAKAAIDMQERPDIAGCAADFTITLAA